MEFHAIKSNGVVHILSTDDSGKITTPLSSSPTPAPIPARRDDPAPAAPLQSPAEPSLK